MNSPGSSIRTITVMGTFATIEVVGEASDPKQITEREEAIERAFEWFHRIEACCSRFEPASELSQLARQIGVPVSVGEILYEAVRFAIAVAEESGGAFDPTVGAGMEARGFNREYRTGRVVHTGIAALEAISYRDVRLDPERRTITLLRPLMLDLGAVAKGLAIDMAARELASFTGFAIDAGGDLFLGGRRVRWRALDRRHPASATRSRAHRRRPRLELRGLYVGRLRTSRCRRRWTSHHRCAEREARNRAGQRHRRGADRDARRCACDRGVRARS